ncbi:class I SAM-dependent methyltransferase [Fulvivirgaceae bacterium PWU4]|uniref:Class I SAM-dependent methyltransferase n=1 Tax=Chryseosolibacter histidini TaxID=2782349 RepID=A0AAP2DPR5_9BACT|nr:class I SAM-dependent methyltransferase [Chryseosolibacter histidini]MBT1698972.1 class I SAM-dependent methyltransferase [Chryseosolibacter histidini]
MTLREQLTHNAAFVFNNKIFYQSGIETNLEFEKNYVELRQREKRVYTDSVVKELPSIAPDHHLKKEWKIRQTSLRKLCGYLEAKKSPKRILELGCGNGWLSHHLALLANTEVLGMDLNETELLQAASVFNPVNRLSFAYADIFTTGALPEFDYIILASSLQYFPDVKKLTGKLFRQLSPGGEIHIIDTPIYDSAEVISARARSAEYFNLQQSGMKPFYHHHDWKTFDDFTLQLLHDPRSITNRLAGLVSVQSPFPWICIKSSDH